MSEEGATTPPKSPEPELAADEPQPADEPLPRPIAEAKAAAEEAARKETTGATTGAPTGAGQRAARGPETPRSRTGSDRSAKRASEDSRFTLASVRSKLASLVWLVSVFAALVLAVAALCVALQLEKDNAIVSAVIDGAEHLDFGVFKDFKGDKADVKEALVNWGIAAVIWMVAGKILDKLIRP